MKLRILHVQFIDKEAEPETSKNSFPRLTQLASEWQGPKFEQ